MNLRKEIKKEKTKKGHAEKRRDPKTLSVENYQKSWPLPFVLS